MTLREWNHITDTLEDCISFCQTLGLIPYSPSAPCTNGHDKWYMGKSSRAHDKYQWRCRAKGCKLTRSIRDGTFFSASRLSIQQLLDLMFYWSQGLDSHERRRHCNLKASGSDWWDWTCGGNRRKFMDEKKIQSWASGTKPVGIRWY
ncbi:unnamed protein product [Didymodactylos carnosus]|uniref:Uncharacterized protein n=1 Tax=Didymodactylos carnosus TaxID=1234261 RepID=A0A8S2TK26_9BILA|nr:unnamed protein product [Didymodactylos carnosus]CAF4285454.1 unnamed protein product [Didymodactylos carnosus]